MYPIAASDHLRSHHCGNLPARVDVPSPLYVDPLGYDTLCHFFTDLSDRLYRFRRHILIWGWGWGGWGSKKTLKVVEETHPRDPSKRPIISGQR